MYNTASNRPTIRELYSQNARAGDVGIEIEVEGKNAARLPVNIGGVWLVKREGSLRNGFEYYTRQPLKIDKDLVKHINKLTQKLQAPGVDVDMSNRTSVHVHVNVQSMTPLQVWTAAVCYWMLEGLLTRFCGEKTRHGNLFCLGIEHAEGILDLAIRDLKNKKPFDTFQEDLAKYGSQNLSSIRRFGSLEYRAMHGTIDTDSIINWCVCLKKIVDGSRFFADPAKVIDYYLDNDKDVFFEKLLSPEMITVLKEQVDFASIIRENALALSEFAYAPADWTRWSYEVEKNFHENADKREVFPAGVLQPARVVPNLVNLIQEAEDIHVRGNLLRQAEDIHVRGIFDNIVGFDEA